MNVAKPVRELRLSTEDRSKDDTSDTVYLEFYEDGEMQFAARAEDKDQNGTIEFVSSGFDLDGDGKITESD